MFDLDKFSEANRKRCEALDGFNHKLNSWEYEQWTNALAGEAGEACNIAKKLLRLRQGVSGNKPHERDEKSLKFKLACEVADVMIYADLLIQALGYDTSELLRITFNKKSAELGYEGCSGM